MKSSTAPPDRWSQYLYDHEIPLREHLRRLGRRAYGHVRQRAAVAAEHGRYLAAHPREAQALARSWVRRRVLTLATALVIVWVVLLRRDEVGVFDDAVDACDWSLWEQWPAGASPHHLVFVADPQLVDPHTYPGRPWPLSSLGSALTDVYLRRGYSRIQRTLDPDTIMFLGDLFDGGREWSTRWSQSPESRYRKYRDSYWMREYQRFSDIFFKEWDASRHNASGGHPGRRIIASLPGNHDLGFAQGVQLPVRDRFVGLFGPSNRMDIIGNHTFVSLDTVSLSAKDDPENLSQTAPIWGPTQHFLDRAEHLRNETIHRHRRLLQHDPNRKSDWAQHGLRQVYGHKVQDYWQQPLSQPVTLAPSRYLEAEYPSILLTHVPLFRAPGTPCGPMRERHPPSPGNPAVDDPNALSISRGYQYQNVVSRELSAAIIGKLGGRVSHAFSGDDHDYCELTHRAYTSPGAGVHEITVKSISMAMGVRHPGFLLVSLWNPVDGNARRVPSSESGLADDQPTLQTHLCILPDYVGILIRYGALAGLTALVLLGRAFLVVFIPSRFAPTPAYRPGPLLPTFASAQTASASATDDKSSAEREKDSILVNGHEHLPPSSSSSSSSLAASTASPRPPASYGYGYRPTAAASTAASAQPGSAGSSGRHYGGTAAQARPRSKPRRLADEWAASLGRVVAPLLLYYLYLAHTP